MATTLEIVRTLAIDFHVKTYGNKPDVCVAAPGRVNLIGEHVDYNDGYVLPVALPLVTLIVGKKTGDKCKVVTNSPHADEPRRVEFDVPSKTSVLSPGQPKWANYVKGVIANFHGNIIPFEATVVTSVPLGGGLSSSASLEVAFYTFLEELTGSYALDKKTKALACQKAEHQFAHMPCGIMDQFASILCQSQHALLLDCRSMETRLVPMKDSDVKIVIINSNVRHELTGSEYSTRRRQCEEAAKLLGVASLRDANLHDLEVKRELMSDENCRRARHVISEIIRTSDAAKALTESNYVLFGQLMLASHSSLRDDFEVSCKELDQLVEIAMEVDGVFGSRMTGGGFGGCTVSLVKASSVDDLISHVKKNYTGTPIVYVCEPASGARALSVVDAN